MKTIPVLLLSAVSCLGLPNLVRGQALPFQQSPPPGTPVPTVAPLPETTTAGVTTASIPVPDGFFMRNGNVYMFRNGALTRVTEEQVLRVTPSGTVTTFDGRTITIPAGQMVTTDGRIVPVDPSLLSTEERTRAASTITGENRSGLAPTGSGHPVQSTSPAPVTQPDGFSQVPNTQGRRSTSSMRGSSATIVDPLTGVVLDQTVPDQGTQATGTTTTNQQSAAQQSLRGTTSTATPNQRASTGTNVGTTSTATPNQRFSTGTATGTSGTTTSGGTSSSGTTSTGTRSTTSGSSGSTSGSSGTSGTGTSSGGTSGGTTVR